MQDEKLTAVRSLLESQNIGGILFTLQKNVSWLTGGRSFVNMASEPACCQILVTRNDCVLISNNIEAARLREEELSQSFRSAVTSTQVWNWYEPERRNELVSSVQPANEAVRTDLECESKLLPLRSVVPDSQKEELTRLGRLTAAAIEQTAMDIRPGDTEYKIAGQLAYRCYERELEPIVNLIAVDDRAITRRHPQPTGKQLESYAMLVVCARKNGLIASASRLVHFGKPNNELLRKWKAVAEIDARIIDATRPGKALGELFVELERYYKEAGYPDEYRMHHQGGLTGYATREKLALPHDSYAVVQNQLYAWNPSIAGVKSEDTIFINASGAEIVTESGEFPTLEIKAGDAVYKRPAILQRENT